MGLDYSYRLYFHRQDLWDVLQGIADISARSALPTLVVFPDCLRAYSIEGWGDKKRIIPWDDAQFGFNVSIFFNRDEAIVDYLHRVNSRELDPALLENPFGLPVGTIYINVYNDLNRFEEKNWDPDIVLIDLGTTGTRMSTLFMESDSIRARFQGLLEQYHGICGVFNMEDYGYLIWHKGVRIDRRLPDPYMSPAEIEAYLAGGRQENP